VWGWGNDNSGELGNAGTSGGSTDFAMQVHGVGNVGFLTGVTSIAVCRNHSLATLADGTALAWGENIYGQLGDGTTTGRNVPVVVSGLTDVIAVTCGDKASLALKADGTIWSWGDNSVGQLGDGNSPTDSLTPVSVSGLSGVKGISGGGNGEHFLAVLSDGTVRDWGWGIYCQLGNGACSTSDVPVTVSGLSDVTSVSGGDAHSLARKSDGTVWGWGYGNQGQLGNGSFSGSNVPVQASGITTAVAVAGGHLHSVALLSDGTVRTWGYNVEGQLGDGTTSDSNTPVTAAGVSGVTAIAAGYLRTIVLNTNGTIQDWGRGVSGDLGNCTYNSNLSPVQVIFGSCPTIPNAVADLAATPGNTSASLTWTAPFDGGSAITAYAVHYSIDAFAFDDQTCADASCTDTTAGASVPGLTNGVLYTFRVYAVNAIGSSAASNTSTATPTSGLSNNTTANQVLMSRLQVGVQSTTSISFTLADTLSSQLTVTFDPAFSGIDVSGAAATTPSAPGCMTNFLPVGGNVFTADKSGCIGDILITGILITNPGTPGSYSVSWTNDDPGYAMVAIVDSDQVTVSATIDPTITFDLNADNDNSADAAPYSVDLGALTIGAVNHTDNGGIPGIWANLDTNATGGAIVTVLSANAALKSISTPGDAIPNSAGTMSGGTANYGLCVENVIGPTWASGIFQATAPYNAGTCDPASASNDVKTLSAVTPTPILDSSSAPVTTGAAEILVNAAISTSTAAHSDYTDTLTFVATGTF
jgi:alpha-tubulin suppressor-like RCC1 family protein